MKIEHEKLSEKELAAKSIFKRYGRFICTGNYKNYIVDKGEGHEIVLIHGIDGSVYSWRYVINGLSRNFRVIAIDLCGSGFSDKPDIKYNVAELSEEVLKIIDLLNLDKPTLIGSSLGGEIVLNIAASDPEKISNIVLIDSLGYNLNLFLKLLFRLSRMRAIFGIMNRILSRTVVKIFVKSAFSNHEAITSKTINSYYIPLRTRGGLRSFINLCKNLSYFKFSKEKISLLNMPTLIIWGKNDSWVSVKNGYKLKDAIKGSTLEVINDCGHGPQEEHPGKVCDLITAFLTKVSEKS